MNLRRKNWIMFIGLITSLAGLAITQAQNWVVEQEMDILVEEKVQEALAKREEQEEEKEEQEEP